MTLPFAELPGWPATRPRPRILACDLSLRSTGLAWTDHTGTIGVATIKPATTGHERLNQIVAEIRHRAQREAAQLAVIELLPMFASHGDTTIQLAGIHWLVRHTLWLCAVPYVMVPPAVLKTYALGKGGGPDASKGAVVAAMQRLYYGQGPLIRNSDEADAAALLALALDAYGAPLADLPATHRGAITAVTWPALESPVPGGVTWAPPPGAGEPKHDGRGEGH